MDKLEYIPGDLVMTRTEPNNFVPNGIICKFEKYLESNMVLIRVVNRTDSYVAEIKQIAPILISPAILEKNGWNKYKREYLKDQISLCACDSACYWSVEYKARFVFFIRHVHQLQHLLFGLRLNPEMEV